MQTEILHGYIIRITPYSDYDAIVMLFTEEMGGISVFVKGYFNSKKRFQGSMDRFLYNEYEVLVKDSSKLSILKSSKIEDALFQIKDDPMKLIYAEHLIELYNNLLTQFSASNFKYFDSMLRYINNSKGLNYASLLVFRFNILKVAGIMPRADKLNNNFFSISQFVFKDVEVESDNIYLTENQIGFLMKFQDENQSILKFLFTDEEKKSFGKFFSALYYSIATKKLLTIPLLKQFF